MPTQFQTGATEDPQIQQQLALYKQPATIRDTKQVYFYVSASATTTDINPILIHYGLTPGLGTADTKNLYYAPIGTTRTFNIIEQVNDLLDIRVPKDKYMFEINMAECVIEADPVNWAGIADKVYRLTLPGPVINVEDTYTWATSFAAPAAGNPTRATLDDNLVQGTKLSQPQTLYVRIPELANGQPYNWAVTNSGNYSIDKSHQLLVRHGDINYARLTLEFGHLAYIGQDVDYRNFLEDTTKNFGALAQETDASGIPRRQDPIERYSNSVYLDYNKEVFNTNTSVAGDYPDASYPSFYKGLGGVDFTQPLVVQEDGVNIEQPANRPPYRHFPIAGAVTAAYNLQGLPLLYSQQASRISFRFLVRIIALF